MIAWAQPAVGVYCDREDDRTGTRRHVADDADVASVAEGAGATHRGRERVLDREADGEEERTRAVVCADAVTGVGDELAQDRLRHVVTARGELVENLLLRHQPRLFYLIEPP